MYSKTLAAACAAFVLGGCAGGSGQALVAEDHPASPTAATAPLPAQSATLAIAPATQTQPAAEAAASEPSRQQHSHDHGAPPPATAPADQAAAVYVCPHHPEVTSTNPNDRCPKCHMKLVRKEGR
jgi:hypothetical protein